MGTADTYSAKQWEDVEEIEKYELAVDALVMCHRCWSDVQSSFVKMVKKNFDKWSEDIKSHVNPVKKAVNTQISLRL